MQEGAIKKDGWKGEDGKKDWKEEVRQNEFLSEKTKLLRDDLLHPFSRRYE